MKRRSSGRRSPSRQRRRAAAYREKKTPEFPGRDAPMGPCPNDGCGKLAYSTRAQADRVARRIYPQQTMRLYQCGPWWHMTSQDAEATERGRQARAARPQEENG